MTQVKDVYEMRVCAQRSWKESVVAYLQEGNNPRFWCRQCEKARRIW